MKAALELLRQRLGPTPRGEAARKAWSTTSEADWARREPVLNHQITLQDALVTYGDVVWGRVALANTEGWSTGKGDVEGAVVFSFDPWFDDRPNRLAPIADAVFSFYGSEGVVPQRPWLRHTADLVRGGRSNTIGLSRVLPPQMTSGRRVLMSALIIERSHLPGGYLQNSLLPLVAGRGGPIRPVRVIPSELWPAQLRSMWRSG